MNEPLLWGYLGLTALCLVDIWASRLSFGARLLWSLTTLFLVAVGPVAWILTRGSAHRTLEEAQFPGSDIGGGINC